MGNLKKCTCPLFLTELTKQLAGDFGKIIDCLAGRSRVFCSECGDKGYFGGYIPPLYYLKGYIRINIVSQILTTGSNSEITEGFLEEAYHALTICKGGSGIGSKVSEVTNVPDSLSALKSTLESYPASQQECGYCLGREMLAKRCAALKVGSNTCRTALNCIAMADSSCTNACAGVTDSLIAFTKSPLGQVLTDFFSLLGEECDIINKYCGA